MRLDKFLSDMGTGTRSECKKLIRAGRVTVNQETVLRPECAVAPEDLVTIDGKTLSYHTFEYFMMNKPAGVVSATEDRFQKTVVDLFEESVRKDLFPVGRLDRDTEGLLLMTNDGALCHRLLSPKSHVDKTYEALIDGIVTKEDVLSFQEGLSIDDEESAPFIAMPATLTIISTDAQKNTSHIEVTIQEGKYHQVKRMFHAVGKEVLTLKRLSMGQLSLDPTLSPGEYRPLTDEELSSLSNEQ